MAILTNSTLRKRLPSYDYATKIFVTRKKKQKIDD